MNNLIKDQLLKCKVAEIPQFNDSTTVINLCKLNPLKPVLGGFYSVQIENYIINQPPNFTLSQNWNNGTKPPELFLNVEVKQIMGNMIRVNCVGQETNIPWEGWLPIKSIKVLKQL